MQRTLTESTSSRYCWFAVGGAAQVDLGASLVAHVSSIQRCGSPWSCPMCAPVVRQQRANEIETAMEVHTARGGSAVFVTFTVRHHQGDELAPRLAVISEALHHVLAGSPWKRRRERLGYVGAIKATEITWGEANGWHPHAHALLLFERKLSAAQLLDLEVWMLGRWGGVVERQGLGTVNGHGVDVRAVTSAADLGSYLAKVDAGWSVGLELARSDRKSAAPMELLGNLVETGEARWAALWREYERATFGRQAIVWSPGLRKLLLGVETEMTDEEAASAEGADLTLLRALIERGRWNELVKAGAQGDELSRIESAGALLLCLSSMAGHEAPPIESIDGADGADRGRRQPAPTAPPAPCDDPVSGSPGLPRGGGLGAPPPGEHGFPPVPVLIDQADGDSAGSERSPFAPRSAFVTSIGRDGTSTMTGSGEAR